jgi:hypothetical protein
VQKYVISELDSGQRVITERLTHVRSVALGYWIGAGARDERDERAGVSHFIEHLLFKGSDRYTAQEIAEIFDGLGGELNAATSREHTVVYARVADQHLETAIDVMSDMVYAPSLADVDAEREVGVEEVILEPPAVDLERAERRKLHRSDLEPLRDVAVAVLREEIAQPEFRELMFGHVLAEAEHVAKVAAGDFHGRFADLERRLPDRMGAFFEDQQADVRALGFQLSRETQAGKATAEDDDVVGSRRGHAICVWRRKHQS